jgi:hypothetical protein
LVAQEAGFVEEAGDVIEDRLDLIVVVGVGGGTVQARFAMNVEIGPLASTLLAEPAGLW